MLTGGLDGTYRGLLRAAFNYRTRLEVWRIGGSRLDTYGGSGLPLLDGTLTATLQNRVARELSLSLPGYLTPLDFEDPTELMSPYWNYIKGYSIVSGGAGLQFEFPIFTGRIVGNSYSSSSNVLTVDCRDRADDIINDGFGRPFSTTSNKSIFDQWALIIQDSQPDAVFAASNVEYRLTPKLAWADDRGQALDDLADAVNAYWYQLPSGEYTLQVVPWTLANAPVTSFINGVGGTTVDYSASSSRDSVYNRIIVAGERADGTTPVSALVQDSATGSTTYVDGPFGRRSTVLQVQSATNQAQATSLGKAELLRRRALSQTWTVTAPPDPSLELGDAVTCRDQQGREAIQVISGFTLPLTKGTMSFTFRDQQPGSGASAS